MMSPTYSLPWNSGKSAGGNTSKSSNASMRSPMGSSSNRHFGSSSHDQEDSAFHDETDYHEYSNPASSYESFSHPANRPANFATNGGKVANGNLNGSSDSCLSSPCPDYEEVDPQTQEPLVTSTMTSRAQRTKGLVYNLASEGIFSQRDGFDLDSDPITKEKIMHSLIFCIHKVRTRIMKRVFFITKALIASTDYCDRGFVTL